MQNEDKISMYKQPLLTIAIPTYNRARYLDLCLKRINEEIASLSEDQRRLVKVYVSDNASPEETPNVIAKYQGNFAVSFEAVRNRDNIGPDLNFTQCYESAKTPYVWIVGDDDVLLPGGLGMVLDAIYNKDIDVMYVNNYWFKESYMEKPTRQENHGTSIIEDPLEFARRTNVMLTFISGLIVRSGIGSEYRSELIASNLVQLSWALPLLRDGKRFAIIQNWVVAAKGANTGGYGLIKVFGENLQRISNVILKDKPELTKAIENGTIVNFFPGFVLELRNGPSKFQDKNMADGFRQTFGCNWRYYVFLAPLIMLPLPIARIYNILLKIFRRLFRSILV